MTIRQRAFGVFNKQAVRTRLPQGNGTRENRGAGQRIIIGYAIPGMLIAASRDPC